MKKAYWKKRIRQAAEDAGTYKPFFDSIIDTLSQMMEMRDEAISKFDGSITIEYTNKGGNTNTVKNPALVLIMELNRDTLSNWRDLGLTPAGLKKINESALKVENKIGFADALSKLGL